MAYWVLGAWCSSPPAGRWPAKPRRWWRSPPRWAPPPPRSSATCSPSGCCGPVAVAALRGGVPEKLRRTRRHPAAGADLAAVHRRAAAGHRAGGGGRKFSLLHASAGRRCSTRSCCWRSPRWCIGLASTLLVAMSIADPLRQLRWALVEVQRGNYNAHMQIYDASELGLLQAGFNDMVRDLSERQRLRDLFGRYVGEDVARRALERGTELGGQERDVAVLFVDLVGSTQLAATRPPAEVVSLLNEFFRVVVDTVEPARRVRQQVPGRRGAGDLRRADRAPRRLRCGAGRLPRTARRADPGAGLRRSSASGCRPAAPSPATSARRPASSTPSSATRSTRPPGSPSWPSSRKGTCWRRRSRSAARWTPRRCAGTSARSSSLRGRAAPTQLARPLNLAVAQQSAARDHGRSPAT